MKKYTIYAAGIHGLEAFNMTFVLFDNFTITRSYGISVGKAKKFVIVTIFTDESNESKVTDLRDKFTSMADPATATKEDLTIL